MGVRLVPGAQSTIKRPLKKHDKSELPLRASQFAFLAPNADDIDTLEDRRGSGGPSSPQPSGAWRFRR